MALQEITWNGLYATQPCKRCFAETQIHAHFTRMRLSYWDVEKAVVRYGPCILLCCALNTDQFLQTDGLAWGEWRSYCC